MNTMNLLMDDHDKHHEEMKFYSFLSGSWNISEHLQKHPGVPQVFFCTLQMFYRLNLCCNISLTELISDLMH